MPLPIACVASTMIEQGSRTSYSCPSRMSLSGILPPCSEFRSTIVDIGTKYTRIVAYLPAPLNSSSISRFCPYCVVGGIGRVRWKLHELSYGVLVRYRYERGDPVLS